MTWQPHVVSARKPFYIKEIVLEVAPNASFSKTERDLGGECGDTPWSGWESDPHTQEAESLSGTGLLRCSDEVSPQFWYFKTWVYAMLKGSVSCYTACCAGRVKGPMERTKMANANSLWVTVMCWVWTEGGGQEKESGANAQPQLLSPWSAKSLERLKNEIPFFSDPRLWHWAQLLLGQPLFSPVTGWSTAICLLSSFGQAATASVRGPRHWVFFAKWSKKAWLERAPLPGLVLMQKST